MKFPTLTCLTILVLIGMGAAAAASAGPQDLSPMLPADLDDLQYVPDDVLMGPDETVYLLSQANNATFRWSVSQRAYIETLSLAQAPERMAYSPVTGRLYLGYPGRVTQVKLGESLAEQPYITLPGALFGLSTADEFVFVYFQNALMPFYHTHHPDGTLVSEKFPGEDSGKYVWSTANRRIYHFNTYSPNHLYWDYIDATGVLSGSQQSPYHPSEGIGYPIRVAPDGSDVVLGSGWVYDSIGLTHTHTLSNTITDAAWAGGNLFTLRAGGSGTQVQKWNADYSLQMMFGLNGTPVRIFPVGEGLLVITHVLGRPLFWILDLELHVVHDPAFYGIFLPALYHTYCPDFMDNFDNPLSGWAVGEDDYMRVEYLNGEYRVLSKKDGYLYLFAAPTCGRKDYEVEVDMRWVGTPGNSYGLVFDLAGDWSSYLLVDINTDLQQYRIYRRTPTGFVPIKTPSHSSDIHPGTASNHIQVIYTNGTIVVYINGSIQANWWDASRTDFGRVGVVSSPYMGTPSSDARFDNFRVVQVSPPGGGARSADEADLLACEPEGPPMQIVPLDDLEWEKE